jgi:hypothetical protein
MITIITASYNNLAAIEGIDQSSLPVYQQSWWVGIARGSARYIEAQVYKDGVLVGSLPYIERKNALGIRWCITPHWSHFGGPVVSQALSDAEKTNVLRQLIAQLPQKTRFIFNLICSSHANDADLIRQAFINAGFEYARQLTFLQSPKDAGVMSRLSIKHRSQIKSADKDLEVMEIDASEFISFYETNLKEAALKSWAPLNIAHDLIVKGREGDSSQVRVIAARKRKEGSPYDAAIACAWDKERYYLWMMTRRRLTGDNSHKKPHKDAMKILIIKATEHAQSLGLTFDVDGITTPGSYKLCKDILKFPNTEFRYIFNRASGLARVFLIYRPKIKKAAAFLGFRKYNS